MASRAAQAPALGLEVEDLLVEDAEAGTEADAEAQDGSRSTDTREIRLSTGVVDMGMIQAS